ncbi:4-methyl-5(B-hydroxyethyl)-thiazole monophosphate biosynthesis protein [Thiosulfatimonas sediminis]|uniref:4-methyl-5(B-hydroxyethyl)-thiazole monophosphate biosynthesis protein n=1 Tax=Thiosulfatimonas sediminis TaxID=2675054 RepID=A0A6F8PSN0_9GAMM|nr:DJ-1 family glyoxalase III [Thiosulfatimonas sediminis]BBP45142.1 4-methyl-5(B-hydroxyethyl)-thiazole monophosphate biosynthesis protein [Thiosulfatimonas sediminis]
MSRVLVPLAQGCEELEAVTITDILVRGGIAVVTASLDDNRIITASRGMQLIAQQTLDEVIGQKFDLIVLPGGLPGADYLQADLRLRSMLQTMMAEGGLVAAICAAPKVLLNAGILDGKQATSYPGVIDRHPAPGMQYLKDAIVQDGQVITSRGPGTAMDFALYLVEQLQGKAKREQVEAALVRA